MKEFFRSMLACLAALFLACGAMAFFMIVMLGALASSSGSQKPHVPQDAILVFDMSANVLDAPAGGSSEEAIAQALGGGGPKRLQTRKVIDAIEAASTDDRIKGIFLEGSFSPANMGSGYGALTEVRDALERFRASGKPVIAYLVTPSTRDMLVASTANRVVMNPLGIVATPGLSAEVIYWGGMFEKYGIGVQIARAGKFKSFGESYSRDHMSDAEREQLTKLLSDVWGEYIAAVARSRNIDVAALQAVIDTEGLIRAEKAKESGMIDEIADFSTILADLKAITGETSPAKTFKQVALSSYIAARDPLPGVKPSGDQVAVVYAEGAIVDGDGNSEQVGGDRLAREIRKLRADADVKAVVLRVNSPGGSAIASEVIRAELKLLHEKKPLVISMGTVAASGGYWISTAGDRIFSEANTITGSIGVIAIIPNIRGLSERFAINIEGVKTGRHADMFSVFTPRNDESMAIIQGHIDDIYGRFIDRVVEARGLERAVVEDLAQGRVWSGADAVENGLVDELGGLHDAIKTAGNLAKLDVYTVVDYPPAKGFLEALMEKLSNEATPLTARSPSGEIERLVREGIKQLEIFNDPAGVYAIMPEFIEIR